MRGSTAADIVIFALFVTLVPPALLALAVWLAGKIRPALGDALQLVFVGLLAAAILLPPIGELLGGSAVAVPVALLAGAGLAALYARAAPVRSFVTVISPAPLLFLVLFLVVSPVSELVLPEGGAEAVAGESRSRTPVVMVVFDELPATSLMDAEDRIDARRFPAFASLAGDATWYRTATTVAGRTTEAVPAMLTGRRPREGDLPIASDHPQSLFSLLSRSHRLSVIEPITDVCPPDLCPEHRPDIEGSPAVARRRRARRLGPPAAARRPRRRPAADRPRLAGLRGRRDRPASEPRTAAALHRGGVPPDQRGRRAGELRAHGARGG